MQTIYRDPKAEVMTVAMTPFERGLCAVMIVGLLIIAFVFGAAWGRGDGYRRAGSECISALARGSV